MAKQVPKTDAVKALVAKATGSDSVDMDKIAVYEAVFANTLPLRRQTGLHAGARIGADVFGEMIAALDNGQSVPVQIMHNTDVLPTGKVLSAKLMPGPKQSNQLQGLFYVDTTDPALISKLDSGTVDEVSVSILNKQLLCSDCGWDYMGDDCTLDNLWGCVCANGHEVGKNGTHIQSHGLKAWSELSLVGRGAVDGAKILPKPKQTYGADPVRLAARGFDDSILALRASVSDTKEPTYMIDAAAHAAVLAEVAIGKHTLTETTAKLTAAEASIASLTASVAELNSKLAAAVAPNAADHEAALALIDELGKAALAATGKAGTELPASVPDRLTLIRETRAALALAIPAGGSGAGPAAGAGAKPHAASLNAFRSTRS